MMGGNTRRRTIAAAAIALAVAAFPMARVALGYFTSSTSAEGGFALRLSPDTDIEETYGGREKHVRISNDATSVPVYVRARAFSSLPCKHSGQGWRASGDGWLYCDEPLMPGTRTEELVVTISFPTGRTETVTHPDGTQEQVATKPPASGDEHDVTVVYESVPLLYGDDGNPLPADECWAAAIGRDR